MSELDLQLLDAATHGKLEVCSDLIVCGADVNAKNKHGLTPLHYASSEGHKDVCGLLLDHGADMIAKDREGLTPLHWASLSYYDRKDVCKLLLNHGADVNAKDRDGLTPLDRATIQGKFEICELLQSYGMGISKDKLMDMVLDQYERICCCDDIYALFTESEVFTRRQDLFSLMLDDD
jgi:ankyrin repeat protein